MSKRRRNTLSLSILTLLLSAPSLAEYDALGAQDDIRSAIAAYRAEDYEAVARHLEAAKKKNPFSLFTQYILACAYARTGRHDESLALLSRLVDQRVDYGMAEDDDLAALRGKPRFQQLVQEIKERVAPVVVSEPRITIEQIDLIPEGIAIDAKTNRIFLSSMRNGNIYVVDEHDQLSQFATVEHGVRLAAIGLYADSERGMLWAAGAYFDTVENFDAERPVSAGVFGFDLASGELKRKVLADNPVNGVNDVTVGPDGTLYVSGDAPGIVRPGSDRIETIETSEQVFGSNGVALAPGGSKLFTSAYPIGIAAIDTASGHTTWLDKPDDVTLNGIDGLYWHEGTLIGVQNGTRPWRLVQLALNDTLDAVTAVRYIEFANPAVTPTTGAIVGNTIYYVGQSSAPVEAPAHLPADIAQFLGKTVVRSAPLD